jgi:hypothetical protein
MNDPFKIIEPTVISFSGGRTSAYMLWRILESNNGLPEEAIVIFANTGKEDEETLKFVKNCSVNWNVPIVLCEGIFDAIAIKRNAIPLLGKTIPKALMMKLIEPNVKTVYVSLDRDALKDALKYAEELLNLGKDVYLIDLQDKDPSDMGFEKFTKLVHEAEQLSLGELIYKKLELA